MSRTVVRSMAAFVVAVALVATLTQVVLATGWAPRDLASGVSQVDADPTPTPTPSPTPEPTPTPTPQSTPTPLPDPTPTPTPFDESEASITALSVIDDDGDPGTLDDRHVFDGEWEFAGEFGTAEVVSADSTSNRSEAAHWFIDYEGVTRVVITDLLRDGYTLLDVECVARSDSREWEVDGTSVIWFPPLPAAGPSGFDCEFIHAAVDFPTPRITLPPTDVTDPIAGGYVDGTLLLLLLIGTSVGVLIVRATRRTRWQ